MMAFLRHLWRKLRYLACTPARLFHQRTLVQLMVSHVAVVLLTFALLNAIAVLVVVGWIPGRSLIGLEAPEQDYFLGERTRSLALWLDVDDIATEYGGVDTAEGRTELERLLQLMVDDEVPGYDASEISNPATGGIVAFGVPRAAFVTDPDGTIIATTDPELGAAGQPVSDLKNLAVERAVDEAMVRHDDPGETGQSFFTVEVNGDTTGAAAPIFDDSGDLAGYLAFLGYPLPVIFQQDRFEILLEAAIGVLRASWVYTIPAILVALPFAYWQSRSTSRRLERLANLADAFADGDLHTRIRVTRHDEIGRLAERFNEMGMRIEEDARTRRAFLSNVSHELRTPVSIIQATVERLQDKKPESARAAEQAIALVNLETHNLTRLIDDLSTLGRLEEAKLRLDLQPLDARTVVDAAVQGLKQLAWTQRKVSIENLVPPDLPLAFADPGRVRQVVHNLLFNALRHTPEGGLIVVQGAVAGDRMEISVSDTGIGIPPDRLQQVFTRYYQTEMTRRKNEGSGLGLHIVQQLIKAQGGTILAESEVGQGTTIRFTLPLSSQQKVKGAAKEQARRGVV